MSLDFPTISLILRFASPPLPDLPLSFPPTSTTLTLRRHLRTHLPPDCNRNSIRLIFSGRVLVDDEALAKGLRWEDGGSGSNIYIHCAISSEPLSEETLKAEETAALEAERAAIDASFTSYTSGKGKGKAKDTCLSQSLSSSGLTTSSTTNPQPHGFDRLRTTAGFTDADISSLRAQFRASISSRNTPDTMPSSMQLLSMEERWLDGSSLTETGTSNSFATATVRLSGDDGSTGIEEEDDTARELDDTLYGVLTGFFWPVGAAVWGLREDGVWSRRRGWSVLAGMVLNLGFGILRVLG